jgi:hypothetical protein
MKSKKYVADVAVALCAVFAMGLVSAGCDKTDDVRSSVAGISEETALEASAYSALKAASKARGGESTRALQEWVRRLEDVASSLNGAIRVLADLSEKDRKAALGDAKVAEGLESLKRGLDAILDRKYNLEAPLQYVPSWRMAESKALARRASAVLDQVNRQYSKLFPGTNINERNTFVIGVELDAELVDTQPACIERVRDLTLSHGDSSFCVDAAEAACGHQVDLSCVERNVVSKLRSFGCSRVVADSRMLSKGQKFDPSQYLGRGEQLAGPAEYGEVIREENPNREAEVFCASNGGFSGRNGHMLGYASMCKADEAKVRVYGYDSQGRVTVEIEGLRHSGAEARDRDVVVELFVNGRNVGSAP